jgi:hypothetical protein
VEIEARLPAAGLPALVTTPSSVAPLGLTRISRLGADDA